MANTRPPNPGAEQDAALLPARAPLAIVGIGASAGGLKALETLLAAVDGAGGAAPALLVVQHLAPDHQSLLSQLLGRKTHATVLPAEDGATPAANHVYVLPADREMTLDRGRLRVVEPVAARGLRHPIDTLFTSLAADRREGAICVVLSGTGTDGTEGAKAVHDAGGLVLVQEPGTAEFPGMPDSAIASGVVDAVLAPDALAARLLAEAGRAPGAPTAPPLLAPAAKPEPAPADVPVDEDAVRAEVLRCLHARSGHDFSGYKPGTIQRRIERRMALLQVPSLTAYLETLRRSPAEVSALFADLLIGVTAFFRDPEAFRALTEVALPTLLAEKAEGAALRLWCAGCSTGEEAYSLVMLVTEYLESHQLSHPLTVFATDIDPEAVAVARAGRYPASIADTVSPERLSRFFVPEADGRHRIQKRIRDRVIFSEHSVLRDPPFSRLDLLSCRNLFIYLDREAQGRLIPIFHYALNPGGFLLLGTSEAVGGEPGVLFTATAGNHLYRREPQPSPGPRLPGPPPPLPPRVPSPPGPSPAVRGVRELAEQAVLAQWPGVGALVDAQGELLYLHGRASPWLEPPSGETRPPNVLRMVTGGLRAVLTSMLREAVTTFQPVRREDVDAGPDRRPASLGVSIVAGSGGEPALFLVVIRPGRAERAGVPTGPALRTEARVLALEAELGRRDASLAAATEDLLSAHAELTAATAAMQSVNEELQSTNEELETSKEELQSVNEELSTVNAELLTKVADLSRLNGDMNNLLAGTGIATLFVDEALCILRYTPGAEALVNLIPGDVGRPLAHLVTNLVDPRDLVGEARSVLDSLAPREAEVHTVGGRWFTMRMLPYRTLQNVVEGVVITFAETTQVVEARAALKDAHDRLRRAAGGADDAESS